MAVRAEDHLGLVHLCANRFRSRGIEYEELYSAGCLGLVKAVNAFDDTRGVCFSTYAVPVIMGEIRHLFRDNGSIRMGRRLYELSVRAARAAEDLRQASGREPSVSEIAAALELPPEEIAEALCAAQTPMSLTVSNEDGESILDIPVPSPAQEIENRMALRQVLAMLPPHDRELIALRYEQGMTQAAAASRLGMTQVQVSRREKKILLYLREQLTS